MSRQFVVYLVLLLSPLAVSADEAVQLLRYPKERITNIGAAVDHGFAEPGKIELKGRLSRRRKRPQKTRRYVWQ